MNVSALRTKLAQGYATELHLSPEEYDQTYKEVRSHLGKPPPRDPQQHREHFLLDGVRVIKSFI